MNKKILDILIVENEDIDYLAVKRHLNWSHKAEFRLTRATSPQAAIEAARGARFHCALIDYKLAQKGANHQDPDLLVQLGAIERSFPMILLTAHDVGFLEDGTIRQSTFDSLEKTALTQQLLQRTIFYAMENHKVMTNLRLALEDAQAQATMKRHILSLVNEQIEPALTAISQASDDTDKVRALAEQGLLFLKALADYTHLHDSDLRLRLESFNGASLFESMIERLTSLARQQGVTVTISHAGLDDIDLQGDREKLGQLVEAIASRLVASGAVGRLSLEASQAGGRLVFDMAVSSRPDEKAPVLSDILSANHFYTEKGRHDLSLLSLAAAYKLISLMKGAMTLPSQSVCRLTIPVTVSGQSDDASVRMLFPARDQYYPRNAKA